MSAMPNMDLYRWFDAEGRLLYVGISLHAAARASEHRRSQPWWPLAVRMDIEKLGQITRAEAETVERAAIIAERPIYNIVHNAPTTPSCIGRLPSATCAAAADTKVRCRRWSRW
jgi:hypothetical protein